MPREIDREEVRAFYERFSDELVQRQRDRIADVCRRELGAEPAASVVDEVLFEMGRRQLENNFARLSEITEEEWHRMISEEGARLGGGEIDADKAAPGVKEEALINAVLDRAQGEYGFLFERRRRA